MALSEKSRSTLFQRLSEVVGEEATGEMLSYFPARDLDEPVTKEHLDRRVAELQVEIRDQTSKLYGWFITTLIALGGLFLAVAGLTITVATKLHG